MDNLPKEILSELVVAMHAVKSPAPPAIGFNIPTGNGDYIAKGEKIDLFWMVFNLDKCWSVAFGLPSVLPDDRSEANSIDTPWSLSPENYEQVSTILSNMQSGFLPY